MSSMWAHPGLLDRSLLPLALCDTGTLDITGVRFDVSGAALLRGGDLVCVVTRLMMSDDTTARSRTGVSVCCGWLFFVTQEAGLVAPPISGRGHTVVLNRRGGVMYVWIVYIQQGSVAVVQETGSLLILFLVCCSIVLCLRSYCELLPEPLFHLVCLVGNYRSIVTVYHISGVMASGDSRLKADRSGIRFRNQSQVPLSRS